MTQHYETPEGERLFRISEVERLQFKPGFFGGALVAIILSSAVWGVSGLFEIRNLLPHNNSTELAQLPPSRFAGGVRTVVHFVPPYAIPEVCGPDAIACAPRDGVYIINPCVLSRSSTIVALGRRDEDSESAIRIRLQANDYTETLCHELGHVEGWRHGGRSVELETGNRPLMPRFNSKPIE